MKTNQFSLWLNDHKVGVHRAVNIVKAGIVCIALIVLALLLLNDTQNVNWQMQGCLVTSDGTVSKTLPVSVTGKISSNRNGDTDLKLSFGLPEDFQFSILQEEFVCYSNTVELLSYYAFSGYGDNKDTEQYMDSSAQIALDADQECIVIAWSDAPGQYLVASTNPNTDPQQVLDHFQLFLNTSG